MRKSDFMDPSSQTITVYVALDPEKNKPLLPGAIPDLLNLLHKTLEGSMEIPRNAVFDKDKVFTVENGKLVEKRSQRA